MNKGDKEKIFEKNKGLVYQCFIKNFRFNQGTMYEDDIMQEGFIGLYKAIDRYDETKGITFSTFAYKYIFLTMLSYVDKFVKQKKIYNKKIGKCKYKQEYIEAIITSGDITITSESNNRFDTCITVLDTIPSNVEDFEQVEDKIFIESVIKTAKELELRTKEDRYKDLSKCIELRLKGASFDEIGEILGVSKTTANYRVNNFLKHYKERYCS